MLLALHLLLQDATHIQTGPDVYSFLEVAGAELDHEVDAAEHVVSNSHPLS